MATRTTNYNLYLPVVGGDDDQWGSYINTNTTTIDTKLKELNDAIADQDLEELGNVVNTTPVTDQVLQFNGQNWSASTLAIADISGLQTALDAKADDSDLTGITTNPADGSVSYAKLNTALQVQVDRILLTDDDSTPTDNQILKYSATDAEWKYADLPGSTVQTLSDVNTAALADDSVMVYNSTAGEFQFESGVTLRTTLGVDASGTDNSTPVTLVGSLDYLTLSGQAITLQPVNLTTDVTDTLPVASGGTGSATASDARTALGLIIGTDVQAYDADTTKNDVSNTFSANQIISVLDNTNAALRITQTGTGNALVVEDSANPDSTPFVVNNTGGVGIGTALPSEKLDVIGNQRLTGNLTVGTASAWTTNTAWRSIKLSDRHGLQATPASNAISISSNSAVGASGYEYTVTGSTAGNYTLSGGTHVFYSAPSGTDGDPVTFSEKMRIDSAGNVGIGTSSPNSKLNVSTNSTDAAVTITQTGTGNALVVEDSTNPDSTPFVVDSSGRLLVGTSNTRILSSYSSGLQLEGVQNYQSSSISITHNRPDSGGPEFRFCKSRGTSAGATTVVNSGDVLARLYFYGTDGSSSIEGARVSVEVDGTPGTNDMPGRLVFSTTADGASSPTERMRIDSSGNVGIGTTSPAQKLDVTGNINATGTLTLGTALAVAEGGTGVTSLGSLDAADLGSGAATDGYVLTADGAGGAAWEAASGGGGGTTAYVEHSSTISDSFTVTSGTNRMYIGGTTFSGTISVAGRLAIVAGPANFTGTINTTGTLAIME